MPAPVMAIFEVPLVTPAARYAFGKRLEEDIRSWRGGDSLVIGIFGTGGLASGLAHADAIVLWRNTNQVIEKLFRGRLRRRNRSLPKYVTPTSRRPNVSLTE